MTFSPVASPTPPLTHAIIGAPAKSTDAIAVGTPRYTKDRRASSTAETLTARVTATDLGSPAVATAVASQRTSPPQYLSCAGTC